MDILREIGRCDGLPYGGRILVGVSGGVDSVVLLHALIRSGYSCVAAHCNFHLRGEAADGDAAFTERFATTMGCAFVRADFDTEGYAARHSLSIEMAARELRYRWFEEQRTEQGCEVIAVAHNADDSVETFFLNVIRGTGIRGICGMAARNGNVIRPLLGVPRREIERYARENGLEWREDATNAETVYRRNKIRHKILPVLQEINPSLLQTMQANMEHWRDAAEVFSAHAGAAMRRCVRERADGVKEISIASLKAEAGYRSVFFEWMYACGFAPDVIRSALGALDGIPGKMFMSPAYILLKDRDTLLLMPRAGDCDRGYPAVIEEGTERIDSPLRMAFRIVSCGDGYAVPRCAGRAAFDADRVDFPLTLRRPQEGDWFVPFGMRGRKKLSDFFTDRKLSRFDKERAAVLVSAHGEVMWVVGMRTDNRFAVTGKTRRALEIDLLPDE